VGFSADYWLNPVCSESSASDVYFCNGIEGLVGTKLALVKENLSNFPVSDCDVIEYGVVNDRVLNVCEIRAYSYIPLSYTGNDVPYSFLSTPV